MKSLFIAGLLAITVTTKCGKVEIPNPLESPSPTPTSSPVPVPSATPPIVPTPQPSPSGTPVTESPAPSPIATPVPPSPVPVPSPTPTPLCGQTPPPEPIRVDSGACPAGYEGGFAVDDVLRSTAVHLCFATSQCKGPGLCPAPWNPESGCRNLRDAMLGGLNKIDSEGVANPTNHIFELKCDPDAGCFVVTNGFVDAWGRRYAANTFPPTSRSYLNDWEFFGSCTPAAVAACPQPTPAPTPRPSVLPPTPPPVDPGPVVGCPKPDGLKIGFFASVKKERGFRNVFNVTPTYQGAAIDVSCGDELLATYGEFDRFVTSNRWAGRDSVEVQSDNAYFLVDATNSDDENWGPDGKYLLAGSRTYCVAYKHLNSYRCQDGTMNDQGQLVGFGANDRGYDIAR